MAPAKVVPLPPRIAAASWFTVTEPPTPLSVTRLPTPDALSVLLPKLSVMLEPLAAVAILPPLLKSQRRRT